MVDRRVRPLKQRPLRPGDPGREEQLAPEHMMHPRPAKPYWADSDGPMDSGIYVEGVRRRSPASLADTYRELAAMGDGAMAWVGLDRPSRTQLWSLAEQFRLHELAIEDAIVAHQRPKLERYGDTLFVVVRTARYLERTEEVDFGEVHAFVGANFVLTVRHGESFDLAAVRRDLEAEPELLALGPQAVLYAILDAAVDGYAPVIAGLQNAIDEIETEVFDGEPTVSRRIYELSREVIEFQRVARPLMPMLAAVSAEFVKRGIDEEMHRYLRDVGDHATIAVERVDGFRQNLQNILTVNAALVGQAQNEEMRRLSEAGYAQNEQVKRISAWAAILFAPTLVGTIYGMNFRYMPELHWLLGYPFALALMAVVCGVLYAVFRHRDWL
ncbi:magnesium and cobalt transport protein CorA [Actinomadura sp. GC306]|uniref:magnesium and cobalt transport protein CorA n=1 Tax=Actinomadura sp. GC306 TaxID=2530367 RepID=UPI001049E1F0|nr:magnesium and cobalt transport protein CorA [Actinomadura sp. GC306]TDC71697.1 magnesium and cobalt transport protein CorA [Actinomadura sp. GC306]